MVITEVILIKIKKLLEKKVIKVGRSGLNEFISGVFTRDKKAGNKSVIVYLKKSNKFVNYDHFKMEFIN